MSGGAKPSDSGRLLRNLVELTERRNPDADVPSRLVGLGEGLQWRRGMTEALRFFLRLVGGLAALALLWIIFSRLMVPAVIESAYRGESLPVLNAIISGQAVHPVEHYLAAWQEISWRVIGMLLVVGLLLLPLAATGPAVQKYLETSDLNVPTHMPAVINTILSLVSLMLVFYLYYSHPVGYVYLIAEDHWAEYGTFVSWAMASCFLTWMVIKDHEIRKPVFVLLALGTFLVAMEEISWGQRIVGVASPTLFAQSNLQGEINLHNLDQSISQILWWVAVTAMLLWITVLLPLTAKWELLRQWCDKLGIPKVRIYVLPPFLLGIFFHKYGTFTELRELFLAIAVAMLSLDLVLTMRRGARPKAGPVSVAMVSVFVVLGLLTAFLVRFYSTEGELRAPLNEFAASAFGKAGMYRQAKMVFEYIGEHPFFLTRETRLRHGVLLMRMGEPTKARPILELAVGEQRLLQMEKSDDPEPYRIAGQALKLLGREEEGQGEFLHALEKDRALLKRVTDARVEAKIRWSLGKTLFASGDSGAASEELWVARAIADRRTQFLIDRWIQENLGRDALAAR